MMKHPPVAHFPLLGLLFPRAVSSDLRPSNLAFVANQMEHTVLLLDTISQQVLSKVGITSRCDGCDKTV
jgi:hypothetical protein